MLHGRRLDDALEHVNGSRYALVHAVAKRARQITLWLTADPAELRAEAAPPPMAGETVSRDPVALSEAEILDGEVIVHWDPDGRVDEQEIPDTALLETDPLLLEGIEGDDEDDEADVEDEPETATPALSQAMDAVAEDVTDLEDKDEPDDDADSDAEELDTEDDEEMVATADDLEEVQEVSLDEVDEDDGDEEDAPEE